MGGFYLNQPDPFFTDIEDAVTRQRGKRFQASPKDWATMETWKVRGVPAHLIQRVIANTRDKINTLSFHVEAVEREYADWLKGQTGRSVAVAVSCAECGDSKEVARRPANAIYDYQLEFVPCEVCCA